MAPERGEKHQIIEAIKASRHNMSEAAKVLGVSRSTLYRRLKKYQIEV
ncbi:helix-turn-helix domain-containing protein [Thalassobacillus sp. C254]|nr:helix-turn-helix domain-containing protein [Thalassobacillus sp. C254]